MVTRDEALRIAEEFLAHDPRPHGGRRVRYVFGIDELPFREPCLYAVDVARCWIAYVDRPLRGLMSSEIVLVAKDSGDIVYSGTANDEG
jgi:hypothetical protein